MSSTEATVRSLLGNSQRLLIISGAGCSTGSGIGDYRDDAGEWKRPPPVQHADFMASHHWRQRYWARSQLGYPEFLRAQPNAAHHTLAGWERRGPVFGVITQNVDGLHQQAGQQQVIDLHGRLHQVICMTCGDITARAAVQVYLEAHNPQLRRQQFTPAPDGDADYAADSFQDICVPSCLRCGGIVKPDVVFFGDSVPKAVVDRAYAWVAQADVVLVVGSSLMVYSSFRFVRRAHELGIPVVAVNRGKTRADEMLSGKITGDCAAVLAALDVFQ